jgi:hypothetical protein
MCKSGGPTLFGDLRLLRLLRAQISARISCLLHSFLVAAACLGSVPVELARDQHFLPTTGGGDVVWTGLAEKLRCERGHLCARVPGG